MANENTDDITLASTSDSLDEVEAALGIPEAERSTPPPDDAELPVEAAPDAPPDEEPPPTDEEEGTDAAVPQQRAPRRNRLQERINELTRNYNTEKGSSAAKDAELQALRARVAELAAGRGSVQEPIRGSESAPAEPAAPEVAPEPQPDDYPTYEGYTKAVAQWAAKGAAQQAMTEQLAQQRQAYEAQQREEAGRLATEHYTQQLAQTREKYEDFAEVMDREDIRVSRLFADGMRMSPVGGEMLYYLAKNEQEAARLHALGNSPMAIREFGRLEARLEMALGLDGRAGDDGNAASGAPTGPRSATSSPPARMSLPGNGNGNGNGRRAVTRAPDPIRPIDGGNVVSTKSPDQMSFQEYKAWRNQQQKAASGR